MLSLIVHIDTEGGVCFHADNTGSVIPDVYFRGLIKIVGTVTPAHLGSNVSRSPCCSQAHPKSTHVEWMIEKKVIKCGLVKNRGYNEMPGEKPEFINNW